MPCLWKEHPIKLATLSHEVPSKELLEDLKQQVFNLEKRFNAGQMTMASDEQNVVNKKEQLQEIHEKVCEIFQVTLAFDRELILAFCEEQSQKYKGLIHGVKTELEYFKLENTKLEGIHLQLEVLTKKMTEIEEESKRFEAIHLKTIEAKTIKSTEISSLEKDLPLQMRDEVILSNHLKVLEQGINNLEKEIEVAKAEWDNIQKQLDIATATYLEALTGLEDKKQAYEKAVINFEEAYKAAEFIDKAHYVQMKLPQSDILALKSELNIYNQKVHLNLSELLKLSQEVKDLKPIDLTALFNQKKTLEEVIETLTKKQILIQVRILENNRQMQIIQEINEQISYILEEQALVNDLSQVANGSSTGTSKITFERYILASFLQEIVDAANVRFHKMSNSRYELLRKNQSSDKRKHAGLDLEVFDYYTGKARDINTLSGGEGFKASLALALGLADIAQAYAGGISLDTMFVDEGFGSLSAESLDHAINCLMDLKEGGRLVGIISHVQELKDRIDAQLVVEKLKTGSRTYFAGL